MAAADVGEIAFDLRNALPGMVFAVESRVGYGREHEYLDQYTSPQDVSAAMLEDLLDPLPGKVLVRCNNVPAVQFHRMVEQVVGERAVVSYSGAYGLAEISAAGVTKAAALRDWCAGQGINSADVCAFGDMPNDLPMLRWAGRSFGVANAHPDVLDIVGEVCASNEHDGVAQVLEAMLADIRQATAGVAVDSIDPTRGAVHLPGSRTYAGPRMSRSDGRVDVEIPGFRATHIAEERPGSTGQGDG